MTDNLTEREVSLSGIIADIRKASALGDKVALSELSSAIAWQREQLDGMAKRLEERDQQIAERWEDMATILTIVKEAYNEGRSNPGQTFIESNVERKVAAWHQLIERQEEAKAFVSEKCDD